MGDGSARAAGQRGLSCGGDPIARAAGTTEEEDADQVVDGLIEALRRGDPEALARLYDLFSRRAFGLAYRVLGDGTDAEDAVQEAFLSLWRQRERLDARRGHLRALLLTIVHRRAIDTLRRRRRRSERETELPTDLDLADPLDVEAATLVRLESASMRDRLATLPDEQRQIVELAYFQGYTHREIAVRLDLPLGTVKSRMRLAMERLRSTFRGEATDGVS